MNQRDKGFTLLELLVSLALFAVIYMVAHGTLANILSGSQVVSAEQKHWQQLDIAFTLMEEDLGFASERSIRDVQGFTAPPFVGQPTDSRAVSPPTMEFSRAGIRTLATDRETGDRRVAYRLKNGKLVRELWQTLDRNYDTTPVDDQLLADVTEFEVRFLNRDGHWLSSWPDLQHQAEVLPVAVDVTISASNGDSYKRIFLVNG
ncbi:MAG: type II secretion system minor pseudopilin GspJ [Acidiferrobacterales bacterium]